MRAFGLVFALAAIAAAQTPNSGPPLVNGVLLERDPQTAAGEFSVRAQDNQVHRYRFDAKTYVERDGQLIDVARLRPGEKIEVVSDALLGLALRYARTVHVVEDPPPGRTDLRIDRLHTYRGAAGRPAALDDNPGLALSRGSLTFSGVVSRIGGERLVLHTRDGDQSIRLRPDTRYMGNGQPVEAAALKPNMRVFVRGGRDIYDRLEAYQVVWGAIFDPAGP